MSRNKLITFCYLFIVGIGLAMAFPVGPEALGPLWTATAALGLLTIAGFVDKERQRAQQFDQLATGLRIVVDGQSAPVAQIYRRGECQRGRLADRQREFE